MGTCHSRTFNMPSPNSYPTRRAPRVKLAGTVLALIQLENRRQVLAKLHQLSSSGGLLQIGEPLGEQVPVEVMFHIGSTTVRARAETIVPIWATKGCFQPFRFTAFPEEDRRKLDAHLQALLGREGSLIETGECEHPPNPRLAAPSQVVLYFDRPEDALRFTVALSSVIFSETRGREDVAKLAREIAKISRVTTSGVLEPPGSPLLSASSR